MSLWLVTTVFGIVVSGITVLGTEKLTSFEHCEILATGSYLNKSFFLNMYRLEWEGRPLTHDDIKFACVLAPTPMIGEKLP